MDLLSGDIRTPLYTLTTPDYIAYPSQLAKGYFKAHRPILAAYRKSLPHLL